MHRAAHPGRLRLSAPASARPGARETFDPLRLCVYATVALLAWLLGPFAVLFFAGLGLAGYVRARRAGLVRSTCVLRDTRVVIAYLALIAAAAAAAVTVRIGALL